MTNEPLHLVQLLQGRAARDPDRCAYVFIDDGESLESRTTYSELDRAARSIAVQLWCEGAQVGDRALLLYPPGLDYIAAFFGCLYAGVIAVPAYPPRLNRSLSRILAILADSEARLALTNTELLAGLEKRLAQESGADVLRWLTTDEFADSDPDWSDPGIEADSVAFLQYTSGSTSTPKGVMVSHRNLIYNEKMVARAFEHDRDSTFVGWLPLYHDMGLIGNVLQPLYVGALAVLMSPMAFLQEPVRWLQAITRHRGRTAGAPNFAYELCLSKISEDQKRDLDLSSWTLAFNGAEPIRPDTMERFAAAFARYGFRREAFYPCYGLAEATVFVSGGAKRSAPVVLTLRSSDFEQHRVVVVSERDGAVGAAGKTRIVGCGRAWLDEAVVIVDPEIRTRCSSDQIGEVWVAGPHVAKGYWNRAEETTRTFQAMVEDTGEGPFMRTGDLGFLRGDELYVTGRIKDLIILRGRNHYPQDLESTVERSHPGLRRGGCAAFSVDVDEQERLVVLQEVKREFRHGDLDEVVETIRRDITKEHEVAAYAVVLIKPGRLPKTSSGKIQRSQCRSAFLSEVLTPLKSSIVSQTIEARADGPGSPAGKSLLVKVLEALGSDAGRLLLEGHLRERVAEVLRCAPELVDPDKAPVSLGVDSVASVELQHRIEKDLGIEVPISMVLDSTNLKSLAKSLQARLGVATPRVEEQSQALHLESFPLSSGQKALWFLQEMAPEGSDYNVARAMRIRTRVDVSRLRAAFQRLLDRHSCLRTTFVRSESGPFQRVNEGAEVSFEIEDAAGWSEKRIRARLSELAREPFDLVLGPLLRVHLFRLAESDSVLLITVHHIAVDLWSLVLLMDELGALYESDDTGDRFPSSQYADFVRFQEDLLNGPRGDLLSAYWKQELEGKRSVVELPKGGYSPDVTSGGGAEHRFRIEPDLTERIRRLATGERTTLFVTLLAAFQVLMLRTTGSENVTVGSPVTGRARPEFAEIVGYFVNMVPLRADFEKTPSFREHLHRQRRRVLGALDHQDYPFSVLVEQLGLLRDGSRSPLFQTAFVLEKPHRFPELSRFVIDGDDRTIQLGGMEVESFALDHTTTPFDLTLMLVEVDEGLNAVLQYRSGIFEPSSIERMADRYGALLEGIVQEPDASVWALPVLSDEEAERLRVWNKTMVAGPSAECIHHLVARRAAESPGALAVGGRGRDLAYGELNSRANDLAHRLHRVGVRPEALVAVCCGRRPEMVVALLGILKAGGAYLVLDPDHPRARLSFQLQDAGVRVLVNNAGLGLDLVPVGVEVIELDLHDASQRHDPPGRSDDFDGGASLENLAYVIYTSGSTGVPKAVEVSHAGLVNLARWHNREYRVTVADRASLLAALSFDASVWELWPYLAGGASVHLPDEKIRTDPGPLLGWLAERAITLAFLPTPLAEAVLDMALPEGLAIRALLTGGDRLRRGAPEDLPFQLVNHYGPTEDTVVTTFGRVLPGFEAPSIGRPIDNTRVYLLDQNFRPVPIGTPGEIFIGGVGVARGYRGRPDLTAASFVPDRFADEAGARMYRSGDRAFWTTEGALHYLGRKDHQVQVRGFRVELGEVEAGLSESDNVREAVVLAHEDSHRRLRLVAYVVLDTKREGWVRELRNHLGRRLPEAMIPGAFVRMESFPLTEHGKVDRASLPEPDASRPDLEEPFVVPCDGTEVLLARIWSEVLGVARIGVNDNFFELGGDSISSLQIVSRARAADLELSPRDLFEHQSIAELARVADRREVGGEPRSDPESHSLEGTGDSNDDCYPLTPMQHGLLIQSLWDEGAGVYIEQLSCSIDQPLELAAFENAWSRTIDRHPALRTAFRWERVEEPLQVVSCEVLPAWRHEDWRDLGTVEQERRLAGLLDEDRACPFDFSRAPLMRFCLVRLGRDAYRFIWTVHHLLLDGWSTARVLREVKDTYRGLVEGREVFVETVRPYRDFVEWTRERDPVPDERFWREFLRGFSGASSVPAPWRPDDQSSCERFGERQLRLNEAWFSDLREFARRSRLTLNSVIQGAWTLVLHWLTGADEVLFGTTVSGRPPILEGIESMVGVFMNTVPMRVGLDWDHTLERWLKDLQSRHTDLRQYETTSLADIERWVEVPSCGGLFDSLLIFENFPLDDDLLGGGIIDLRKARHFGGKTPYPVTILALPTSDLLLRIVYDARRFPSSTIACILERFALVLREFVDASDRPLKDLRTPRRPTTAICSSFTVEPIADALAFWGRQLDQPTRIRFEPFGQVFQPLLDPTSEFGRNRDGANVALVRLDDWLGADEAGGDPAATLKRSVGDFANTISTSAKRSGATHFVVLCPSLPTMEPARRKLLQEMASLFIRLIEGLSGVHLIGSDEIDRLTSAGEIHDEQGDALASLPYRPLFYAALGTSVARAVSALHTPPIKVIVLDADETLWTGVCAEDGVDGVVIDAPRRALQEFMVAQHDDGVLLCLCSKNSQEDVERVFDQREDMILTRDHFVAWRVNWKPKSENIRELATELRLGLDSFLFLDDNPVECAQVRAGCPEVIALELPPDPDQIPRFLDQLWVLDRLTVTGEDRMRTDLYRQEIDRVHYQADFPSFADFLSGLELKVEIAPLRPSEVRRVAQLTQRTNQFNFTTKRWTHTQVEELFESPVLRCLTVTAADRFGDYGLVGVMIVSEDDRAVLVDTLLLSCRALGRGVENQMFERLATIASDRGLKWVRVSFLPTEKNEPALEFLRRFGTGESRIQGTGLEFNIPVEVISAPPAPEEHRGGRAPSEARRPGRTIGSHGFHWTSPVAFRLASHLHDAKVVLESIESEARVKLRPAQHPFVAPRTPTEELVAGVWADVLGADRVGVRDDFFQLGGHSLLATRVMSRLCDAFEVDLPLAELFERRTPADLGRAIDKARRERGVPAQRIEPVPRTDPLPLSFAQERLWFLDQLEPGSDLYNVAASVRLRGRLDVSALRASLDELIRRHEVLRTTFPSDRGRATQRIAPPGPCPFRIVDVHDHPQVGDRISTEEARRPFDLERGPLFRIVLTKLTDEEHVLLVTMHHIVSDGWSTEVLVREVSTLYEAFSTGRGSPLNEPPIQYADFAVWHRRQLEEGRLEAHLRRWKEELHEIPSSLDLPTDRPRPRHPTYRGAQCSRKLDRKLSTSLARLSDREGATLFMTLLAAFKGLLRRYSGQDDLVVGSAVANRTRPEIEELVGFFVNTLVLRTKVVGDPTFRELLSLVRQTCLRAYSGQDVPFEKLVEELQPERDLSRTPLFQVAFELQRDPVEGLELPGLSVKVNEIHTGRAKYDLLLQIRPTEQGIFVTAEYATDLFDRETINRFLEHFEMLLRAIESDPDGLVSRMEIQTDEEFRKTLFEWNKPSTFVPTVCLPSLFEARVDAVPDATAVFDGVADLSYRELNERANRCARHLRGLGVGPEVPVGVCMGRSLDLIVALFAVMKAGGAYVPLDPLYPGDRLAFLIEDSGAACVLTRESDQACLPRGLKNVVCLETERAAVSEHCSSNLGEIATPQNLAYVIYTSGSTGTPKGVMVPHASLVNYVETAAHDWSFQANDRVLQFASISFDAAAEEIFPCLIRGATLVLRDDSMLGSTPAFLSRSAELGLTVWDLPTAFWHQLAADLAKEGLELPEVLRLVVIGGERVAPARVTEWIRNAGPRVRLVNTYGPTEATIVSTQCDLTGLGHDRIGLGEVPIGRPVRNVTNYVLDERQNPVPTGVSGELFIGGAGVSRGYLGRSDLTAERFLPDPFSNLPGARLYATGDVVRYRADGEIEFLGRTDQQVKIRGFRVELGEIESLLHECPRVRECVVEAQEEQRTRRLVAYVVPDCRSDAPIENGSDLGQVRDWQMVFDDLYRELDPSQVGFYVKGWDSSYTGVALPEEEVREWSEQTIERVRSLRPSRILELGCGGSGLMLLGLAPHCREYCASDVSQNALDIVSHQVEAEFGSASHVQFVRRAAHDFTGVAPRSFDAVLIVSVAQYFPSIDYLVDVLTSAVEAIEDGGVIFVGDVRSLPLLASFHASVQRRQAKGNLSTKELERRVREAIAREQQLVIDPVFFETLKLVVPRITGVEIQLERGPGHNELTRFRYDAVIHIGNEPSDQITVDSLPAAQDEEVRWSWLDEGLTLTGLRHRLRETTAGRVVVSGIPNARVLDEVRAWDRIEQGTGPDTVGELNSALRVDAKGGIDPEDLWSLGDELAFHVVLGWMADGGNGSLNVVMRPLRDGVAPSIGSRTLDSSSSTSLLPPVSLDWTTFANAPWRARTAEGLVPELREFLGQRLPNHMVPSVFAFLPDLPRTPSGKIDRRALPDLEPRGSIDGADGAYRTPHEEIVAGIWSEILGVDPVGVDQNFFDLGGHSLLATRVISRIRTVCDVEVPLRDLFDNPTISGLAARLEATIRGGASRSPAPIQRVVDDGRGFALSFAQQRLWFLEQWDPGNPLHTMPAAVDVVGGLDVDVFERALTEIIRRHEILRTTFTELGGRPRQVVVPLRRFRFPIVDLTGLAPADREAAVSRLVDEDAGRAFDFEQGSLVRASLVRLEPDHHVLLFAMHHIVSDAWSLSVLIRELSALVRAFGEGRPSPLAEPSIQYSDFATWQRESLQGEVIEGHLRYWCKQLGSQIPAVALKLDRPRPEVESFRGASETCVLSEELSSAVRDLSRSRGVTLFVTMLASYKALLYLMTDQEDIVVGTDLANRTREEVEGLIGFFINLLVLRTDLGGNPRFEELLRRVQKIALEAYGHQDLPFDRLVEELQPERERSRTPLFQVLFVLENVPVETLELPGVVMTPLPVRSRVARFDLALFVSDEGERISLNWNYKTDLFDASTIRRLASSYEILLEQVTARPDTRLRALDFRTRAEVLSQELREREFRESKMADFSMGKRRSVDLSKVQVVKTGDLRPDSKLPWVVEPAMAGVDLVDWVGGNRELIEAELIRSGAILFRDFGVESVSRFEEFAATLSPELFDNYGDLPREGVSGRVYRSTPYPSDQEIRFHNESSHLHRWPRKQWFYCVEPAEEGGDTPIVDCRKIHQRLDPMIRDEFAARGLLYLRHFTENLDVAWESFFGTSDRGDVEDYCRRAGIEFEWTSDGGLRTRNRCQAVSRHPKTGELLFFNQILLHHISCLPVEHRESMRALFSEENLPRNVYYGDGAPIADSVVDEIRGVYRDAAVRFPWQQGDILMLDNMLVAHARDPFLGSRKIVVAMAEMIDAEPIDLNLEPSRGNE